MPKDDRFTKNRFYKIVSFPISVLTLSRPVHRVVFFGVLGLTLAVMPLRTLGSAPQLSVWKRLFGWSPSEGMTRGVCAFLHGDIETAVAFHVLSIPAALIAVAIVIKDSVSLIKSSRLSK